MNFSISDVWNNSLILRYPQDKIIKLGDLLFYKDGKAYKCQHFFDYKIDAKDFKKISDLLEKGYIFKFNYVNELLLNKLEELCKMFNCNIKYIDVWDAPILTLQENLKDYFSKIEHTQIKKNYKHYELNRQKFKFYNSQEEDILKLWNYVLTIDFNSWKRKEKSDMKSLDREDLQYLPYLLTHKENSNLIVVCDLNDIPLAYSLMFKGDNECWYAVKWGASYLGRKKYIGFYALFNHIEYLYSINENLIIDFWGRRNLTYDKIKNSSIKRNHIFIYKGDE